jgi:pyruvate dehydrogenase E2 component (dihydrolipoamide acetyltransferase)
VKVGTVIATLAGEDEEAKPGPLAAPLPKAAAAAPVAAPCPCRLRLPLRRVNTVVAAPAPKGRADRRLTAGQADCRADKGVDLKAALKGSGPNGRIVKADVENAVPARCQRQPACRGPLPSPPLQPVCVPDFGIPFEAEKLGNVRKVIARRLTEAKQTIPHIYLTVDIRLDALLKLRGELNKALEPDGVKLSVNDLLIKALAKALIRVPKCNVSFAGDELRKYARADISVAVAAPSGLITPIIVDAATKGVAQISAPR